MFIASPSKNLRHLSTVLIRLALGLALVIGFITHYTSPAIAGPLVQHQAWVTDGYVASAVMSEDTVYIGGDFNYIGPPTGGFGILDNSRGNLAQDVTATNGAVKTIAPDGSGGWYIGGTFSNIGGVPRGNLAHILPDGTLDPAWSPTASGGVPNTIISTIAVSGTTVYIGGYFTNVAGQARMNIAALDSTTGTASSWNPNASAWVEAIAVSGNTVFVGGNLNTIGGQPRHNIAAIDATTGLATPWDPNANGTVFTLAVKGNTVYVGGGFSTISGAYHYGLAVLDATTGLANAWEPVANVDAKIMTLVVRGTIIYIGGQFTQIGGQPRHNLAALDTVSESVTDWNPQLKDDLWDGGVFTLALSNTTLYIGGTFTAINGEPRQRLAAIDTTTGALTSWNPLGAWTNLPPWIITPTRVPQAIAITGDTVAVGGAFTSIGGKQRHHLAALNVTTGAATDWDPQANGQVYHLDIQGNMVYASGQFTQIGGQPRGYLAMLDRTTGIPTSWNPDVNGDVLTFSVHGDTTYIGGTFSSVSGQARNNLASIDTATGIPTSWSPNVTVDAGIPVVYTLMVDGPRTYVGGKFTHINGYKRNALAEIDTTSGLVTDWDPNPTADTYIPFVYALALKENVIYVGGSFSTVGGQSRSSLAALDATTGTATSWNPRLNEGKDAANRIFSLSMMEEQKILVGGEFISIGGQPRNNLAILDTATGDATTWDPNITDDDAGSGPTVISVAVSGSTIYVGGLFSYAGASLQPNSVFFQNAAPDVTTGPATNISPTTANLEGFVNAHSYNTTATFQYTTISGSYTQLREVAAIPSSVSDMTMTRVYANLNDLIPNTTYYYRIVATNSVGTNFGDEHSFTTSTLPGTTPTIPNILSQPTSQRISSGQTATLTVAVNGSEPFTYQWYQGESGDTRVPIVSATGRSYTTPPLSQTTSYWVRVSNAVGNIGSATTTITVATKPTRIVFVYLPIVRR